MTIKKGYRKVFVCISGFVWALIVLFLVWLLFKKTPESVAAILGVVLGFGSSIVLYLFASNYGEHKEENKNVYTFKGGLDDDSDPLRFD